MMFSSTACSDSSTGMFGHAFGSNTLPTETVFGAPSYSGFGSSITALGSSPVHPHGSSSSTLVNGPMATRLTYNLDQSHFGDQVTGSRLAVYKRTAEAASRAEKLVSISAMPAYEAKSHEELRWEHYVSQKGGFGLSTEWSTSPATNFSTASWGNTSISSRPVIAIPSVAAVTTTWNYPGPTSTSFTLQPFRFATSANTCLTTVTSAPSSSFNPFIPRTNLTSPSTTVSAAPVNLFNSSFPGTTLNSAASTASSVSLAPLNHNPFTNPSTSLAAHTSSSSFNPFTPRTHLTSPASTTVCAAPLNLFNSSVLGTSLTSAASTASLVSLAPLNYNPFSNPSSSLAAHTSSCSFNPFISRTNLTTPASTTVSAAPLNLFNSSVLGTSLNSAASTASSVSLAPFNQNPFPNPSPSLAAHTSSSSFNPFTPRTHLTSAASTTVSAAPLNLFNPFVLGTTSAASTTSSLSLSPLNHNPFPNPSTSLATHTSSSYPTFAAFTGVVDRTPSSLNDFWSTPIAGPFISSSTAADNSILVSPVSSGLSSTFNQPTTLFKPCVPSAQDCNGSTIGVGGQSSVSQLFSSQITSTGKPSFAASPFGTLPPNPWMFYDGSQSKQSTRNGISSLPVKDKPAPVKYSLLTTRNLSARIKLPVRKYDPKLNAPKKPYFSDAKEIPVAAYVPRENPRALVVSPEKWPLRAMTEDSYKDKFSGSTYENETDDPAKDKELLTTVLDVPSKLQQPDYYTQPHISELEAKERAEPGFCKRVKDFVVGRHGYGSIKFLGETDVSKVDIEAHVQFNFREVIVYTDDSKKPPVGKGLNKPAEITLLNIKCIDKKTGMQCTEGSKINKYKQMLKKKAVAQSAEFLSYDPVQGEWIFRVQHF